MTERQVMLLARGLEKRLAERLASAVRKIQAGVRLTALERAIVAQNFEAVAQALGLREVQAALRELRVGTATVREQAWFQVLAKLPPGAVTRQLAVLRVGSYARQSPRVMAAIRRQDLSRIQGTVRETRAAVRQTLTASLKEGRPVAETARLLRDSLGLNRRQAQAVRTLRADMVARGVDPALIAKRIERETTRKLNQRATVVARTETMEALSAGRRLQNERLVTEKIINADQWEQEWVTAIDERVCPICDPLNGERFPVGGTIATDAGTLIGPPAHPQCRCIARLVLKGFRAGQAPSPVRAAILRKIA